MTPAQVWQGYDPEAEELNAELIFAGENQSLSEKVYAFSALTATDGAVRVRVRVYNEAAGGRAVIIAQDYYKKMQRKVIEDLASSGMTVFVPDLSGIDEEFPTEFPKSFEYGNISKAGDRLSMVYPTAKDTCQYLYSLILKRSATFALHILPDADDIVLIGVENGVEVAMQAAASDPRISALVCINGAGYKEYARYNKYGAKRDLVIDHALLCWLTGVASVAYVKHIDAPILILLSSNGSQADIDRLQNLLALTKEGQASTVITPGSHDNIDLASYDFMKQWLESVLSGKIIPKNPTVRNKVSEKMLYAEVVADSVSPIKEVKVYYSVGEYNHVVRNWNSVKCEMTGENEFLAKLEVSDPEAPLFSFCEVIYEDGSKLSSVAEYTELAGLDVKKTVHKNSRIVYESSMGIGAFTEEIEDTVILENTLELAATPIGLKGVRSGGSLISYGIGDLKVSDDEMILQIDVYVEEETDLVITLFEEDDEFLGSYSVSTHVLPSQGGAFSSLRFDPDDFKTESFMPLESWEYVKAIKIINPNVIVGKILFI